MDCEERVSSEQGDSAGKEGHGTYGRNTIYKLSIRKPEAKETT